MGVRLPAGDATRARPLVVPTNWIRSRLASLPRLVAVAMRRTTSVSTWRPDFRLSGPQPSGDISRTEAVATVARVKRGILAVAGVCLLAGCVDGNRMAESPPGGTPSPSMNASSLVAPLVASSPGVELPGPCGVESVGRRLAMLIQAVNRRDGKALARSFQFGPDLRWETYGHFDPPNGTAGGLRTRVEIEAFVDELSAGREVWTNAALVSPLGSAGLPEVAGYGLSFTVVRGGGAEIAAGAKVAMDCRTGLITHMVGPS